MRKLHILWGWIFAGSFAASGFWMQHAFPSAWHGDRGMRMFYRSAHVYILLGALLNSVLGAYLRPARTPVRQRVQLAGSALVLMSPVFFTLAFWFEAEPGGMSRPLSATGLAVAIFGALGHLFATREQGLGPPAALEGGWTPAPSSPAPDAAAGVAARPSRPEPDRVPEREPLVGIEQRIVQDWTASRTALARVRARLRAWGWRRVLAVVVALGAAVLGLTRASRRPAELPRAVAEVEVEKVLARTTIAVQPEEQAAVREAARAGLRFAPVQLDAVIDLETNLMWAPRDNRNGSSWEEARLFAESYEARGYSDWRLPTIEELLALSEGMRTGGPEPAPGSPSVDPTLPVGYGVPWSSEQRGTEAARVHLSSGSVGWVPQTSTSHNRSLPVRDGGASRPPPAEEVRAERAFVREVSDRLFAPRDAQEPRLRAPP
ncbi:MAG: DUF1566 domain-containing protein [bacterium]